jgi:hypothetical protein
MTVINGHLGMFEGDLDLDIACDITHAFAKKDLNDPRERDASDLKLNQMVFHTDMMAPKEAKLHYQTNEYKAELAALVKEVRENLDSGLCDKLFDFYRAKKETNKDSFDNEYRVIVLGAL